jgi:hypothetical protein
MIIGITGCKQAGKTTAANMLKELFEQEVIERPLAGFLKLVCSLVFDIELLAFEDPNRKEKEFHDPIRLDLNHLRNLYYFFKTDCRIEDCIPHMNRVFWTPRQVLQYVGTEIIRSKSTNAHSKQLLNRIGPELSEKKVFVIPDMRFIDEVEYFTNLNEHGPMFFLLAIHNKEAEMKGASDSHASEKEYGTIRAHYPCIHVDNNGTFEDLRNNLKQAIQEINNGILKSSLV